MMKDKVDLTTLASELLAKTRERKIRWKPANYPAMYSTTIKKEFAATVQWDADYRNLKRDIRMSLWDKKNRLIAMTKASELENPSVLDELFEIVQEQQALGQAFPSDQKVEDLVETLRKL
jgi:hypothetical protein